MPIYEFQCSGCGRQFEELVFSSSPAPVCPDCGSAKCSKLLSSFRLGPGGGSLGSLSMDPSGSRPSSSSSCGSCAASSCAGCGSR